MDNNIDIMILTQDGCLASFKTMQMFEEEDVEFIECNVTHNPEKINQYNLKGTPLTVMHEDGREKLSISGYNIEAIKQIISRVKQQTEENE